MRKLIAILLFAPSILFGQSQPVHLPSNQILSAPAPGEPQRSNSLPTATAVSPDGRYVALLNTGYGTSESHLGQSITIFDRTTGRISDFADERLRPKLKQTYFFGLAFSPRGDELYASVASLTDSEGKLPGDTGSGIAVYSFSDGKLATSRFLKIPPQKLPEGKRFPSRAPLGKGLMIAYPAGLCVLPAAGALQERLLIAGNLSDQAWLLDAHSGELLKSFDLSDARSQWIPATMPYTVASDGANKAWVSLWNSAAVAELDLDKGTARRIELDTPKGSPSSSAHATAMLYDGSRHVLYITLTNIDEVIALDAAGGKVISRVNVRLPRQRAGGAYPNALALGSDVLYVAEAGTNSVAVLPIGKRGELSAPTGFIPTEYYPTALAAASGELVIGSGKGTGTAPNAVAPDPESKNAKSGRRYKYIGELTYGSVAHIAEKEIAAHLAAWSATVMRNNLIEESQPKISFRAGRNPIHHVIYIIKENRTYDQIFGDLGVGNGDPALAMFGEEITPNHHKLARQFGVLDNFYDSGEVSGNGHVWSTAAITSDYNEKIWPINYRNGQHSYDFEGTVAGEYPFHQHITDVNEPATGYLWANAARSGVSYRHYGEFVNTEWCTEPAGVNSPASTGQSTGVCTKKSVAPGEPLPEGLSTTPGKPSPWPWTIPLIARNVPTKPELVDHFDPNYADFRLEYPDQYRADEFLREFAGFVAARARGDHAREMPALVVMRLPNDHTSGTRPGMPTPQASLKDNDLALGRVVEAVSHSPYWDDTAILALEDDAQNGPDHVDAHRSIALVISKYAPREANPHVEHGFYTTVNMIRTIEDLLEMPPMSHNDAQAAPIAGQFAGAGDQPPFDADRRHESDGSLYEANAANAPGAKQSSKMDFSHEDKADPAKLNAILWRATMGSRPMPKPKHELFPAPKDDD